MQLFYLPGKNLFNAFKSGDVYHQLPADEAIHAAKVLRLKSGDSLTLTDGNGSMAKALLEDNNPKSCTIRLIEAEFSEEPKFRLHLAVAPTKNIARFEWFLEKATEFGLAEITPVYCDHSEREKLRTDRLMKVLVSAMKQSLKSRLPKLNEPVALDKVITGPAISKRFIAWVDDLPRPHLKDACKPGTDVLVLIGPEGDFSQREIKLALDHEFKPVSLGKARLRTETAALASCFIVNLLNEPSTDL